LASQPLEALREAGRIAALARERGSLIIGAGARVRDVCVAVEEEIRRLGGEVAFPVQSSRNHVAAHYCPSPEDETVYARGDLAKLDIGVHVDGYLVDTALTVNVGDDPERRRFVAAASAALEAAIATAGPDAEIRQISSAIESTIRRFGLRPMRNLCGHGVGRWTVHCPPPIPNSVDGSSSRLRAGAVIAIEPFATDGQGVVVEQGKAEVFRMNPSRETVPGADDEVVKAIRAFRGLPFARRHLALFPRDMVEAALKVLLARNVLMAYAPLAEAGGSFVAQAEHTLYVGKDGVEVLTR